MFGIRLDVFSLPCEGLPPFACVCRPFRALRQSYVSPERAKYVQDWVKPDPDDDTINFYVFILPRAAHPSHAYPAPSVL